MYQKRKQKRNEKRIEKRNQEEKEEEREEEQEEMRKGLSKKRYVSSCIIENMSLIFTDYSLTVYRWMED